MAEALQKQGFSDSYPDRPRTARQLSAERDAGSETGSQPRSRQSTRPRKRQVRSTGGGSNTPRRPQSAKTGTGARLLAPLAIIVFALAAFMVMNSGDSDTAPRTEERSSSTSESESSVGGAETEPTTTRSTYKVKPGESLSIIAEKFNIDVDVLLTLNPDVDPRALQAGQKLKLK